MCFVPVRISVPIGLICLYPLLVSGGFIAISLHDFEARYPIEMKEQQIFPSEKLPLVREKEDAYLVEYKSGEAEHVVAIRKYDDSGRRLAFEQAGIVQATTTYFEKFAQGYIVVSQGMSYDVLEGDDQSELITIKIPWNESSFPLSVPAKYFAVRSRELLQAKETEDRKALNERVYSKVAMLTRSSGSVEGHQHLPR